MNKRKIGGQFESLAADYLMKKGFRIIERNFRCRQGEIDLIAEDGGYLVFTEVKYRSSDAEGDPLEAVDLRKIRKITYTARVFLMMNGLPDTTPCRFDVIGIHDGRITHIENAFDAL